jgi:ABC-type sugar transport system ATPase subunit
MVGRSIPPRQERGGTLGAEVLRLESLCGGILDDISLRVRAGEIVGLAGLVGAGRSELLETICGLRRVTSGTRHGAATPVLVPEDRANNGLIKTLSLRENVFLPAATWCLQPGVERRVMQGLMRELQIRAPGVDAEITTLSGGNQQKVLLARALRQRPKLLLLDEPTAGVDVGAKAEIHAAIRRLAALDTAILLASSDLPELLELADQIMAMRQGRIVGRLGAAEATESALAALITGAQTAMGDGLHGQRFTDD